MTGKTHVCAGVALAICIVSPKTLTDIPITIVSSCIGAMVCDVDVHSSSPYRKLMELVACIVLGIAVLFVLDYAIGTHFVSMLHREIRGNMGIWRPLLGLMAFLLVCMWGSTRPHRSFMHSLLGMILLSGCVYIILPACFMGFAIGMGSHIVLDMLNHKRVRILYPMHKGIALGLCQSDGTVDSVILGGSIILFVWQMYHIISDMF